MLRVINCAKPKKLIYFAIDGVAPRAKMNHQRQGRFNAQKVADEEALRQEEIKAQFSD